MKADEITLASLKSSLFLARDYFKPEDYNKVNNLLSEGMEEAKHLEETSDNIKSIIEAAVDILAENVRIIRLQYKESYDTLHNYVDLILGNEYVDSFTKVSIEAEFLLCVENPDCLLNVFTEFKELNKTLVEASSVFSMILINSIVDERQAKSINVSETKPKVKKETKGVVVNLFNK